VLPPFLPFASESGACGYSPAGGLAPQIADPPEAWRAAGFHVDGDGACQVGGVTFNLTPGSGDQG
jgi:hypothetical protein